MTSRIRISGTEFNAVVRRNSTFAKKLVPHSFDVFTTSVTSTLTFIP